ncbi:MAG: hypothetical protein JO097_04200 [Acidobacteriaceae bacterium]|nr:hypothetical protein [Acidobacteriaceae bacterium]MBV9765866.1 hypothetical protein [Acidobacteriaceae bacterium]
MCPLCSNEHALLNCMHYVTASQNLKDFLGEVYDKLPSIHGTQPVWEKIYDNFYNKSGDVEWEDILHGSTIGITHRVYLSVKPASLHKVWSMLTPSLQALQGFKMAKRCRAQDAAQRLDAIVIYVGSVAARDAVVDKIRMMLRDPLWNQPFNRTKLTPPAKLSPDDFKNEVLPGTGRIADLQGVSVAADPGPGLSFGQKLCKEGEVAYSNATFRQSRLIFVGYALGCLSAKFDIRAPWR